ncbi:MAG: ParB/RepB/Spo0J family partition protein [Calditrichaeota bacterium]|nr:ParB/RepB/Spo0J family partition protein [Calditrichota bacterium]
MKKPKQQTVNLNDIDFEDKSYIFTFEPLISDMVHSIQAVGLIHPPLLEKRSDGMLRIISGLRRIIALKHLKQKKFPALVYIADNDKINKDLFLTNLHDNLATREINVIEKAFILHKLIFDLKISKKRTISDFLPLLGFGQNSEILDRYLPLTELPDYLKAALLEDTISIETAQILGNLPEAENAEIFLIFQKLNLGKNRQKELLRLLSDIQKVSSQPPLEILKKNGIQEILQSEKLTPPVKTQRIIGELRKIRYPIYSKIEDKFLDLKKELKLPPAVRLSPPPYFEGRKFTLEFTFSSQKEFDQIVTLLEKIKSGKKIKPLEKLTEND